jgi:hypothetical protein
VSIYDYCTNPPPEETEAAPPPEPGLLSQALSTLLSGGEGLLRTLNYGVGAVPRVGIGKLVGAERGPEQTWAGPSASGDAILEALGLGPAIRSLPGGPPTTSGEALGRFGGSLAGGLAGAAAGSMIAPGIGTLLGLGLGTVGGGYTVREMPGTALEMATDPLMWVGGGLTKKGAEALRLLKVERFLRAAEAAGVARGPLEAIGIKEARTLAEGLRARGVLPLAETLAERGAAGQTSLLTAFGRPVPILGGRVASEIGLGALGKLGGALRRGAKPLDPLMEQMGRLGNQLRWGRQAKGEIEAGLVDTFLEAQKSRAPEVYEKLRQQLEGAVPEAQLDVLRANLERRMPGTVGRTLAQLDIGELPREVVQDPKRLANAMLRLGIQEWGPATNLPGELQRIEEALGGRLAPHQAKQAALRGEVAALKNRLAYAADEVAELSMHPADMREIQDQIQKIAGSAEAGLTGIVKGQIANIETKIERLRTRAATQIAAAHASNKVGTAYIAGLSPEFRAEVQRQAALRGEILSVEQFGGSPTPNLHDFRVGYEERYTTPEFKEWAGHLPPNDPWHGMYRVMDVRGPFTEMRSPALRGYTSFQIEALARERGYTGPSVYVENLSDSILRRMTGGGRSMGVAAVTQGVVKAFNAQKGTLDGMDTAKFLSKMRVTRVGETELKVMPKEFRELAAEVPELAVPARTEAQIREALKGTVYENTVIPREYADKLLEVRQKLDQPEELKKIAQGLNRWLAVMRYSVTSMGIPVPKVGAGIGAGAGALGGGVIGGMMGGPVGAVAGAALGGVSGGLAGKFGALALFPGYHNRNVLSNFFMSWLAGMNSPLDLRDTVWAWKTQNKYARALADPINGRAILASDPDIAIMRQAMGLHAYGGMVTGETAALTSEAFRGEEGPLMRAMGRFADPARSQTARRSIERSVFLENNAKLALYRNQLRKGFTPQEGANTVIKYLFDYSDLSHPIDKQLRKVMYFWTYARKAFPLMLREIFENPRKMRLWAYGTGLLGSSDQKALLRNYEFAQNPIPGGTTEQGERIFWDVGLPPAYLTQITSEGEPGALGVRTLLGNLAGMLAPQYRGPVEFLTGRSLSTGKPQTVGQFLAGITPASRIMSSLRTLGQIKAGEKPPMAALGLFGARPIFANPRTAPLQKKLDAMRAWAANEALLGNLQPYQDYYAPKDILGRERYTPALRYMGQLQRRLAEIRQGGS